jgi:hypothetical protein
MRKELQKGKKHKHPSFYQTFLGTYTQQTIAKAVYNVTPGGPFK